MLSLLSPLFLPAPNNELDISIGAPYVVFAGIAFSSSFVITMKFFSQIPVPIISLYRTVVGTILYHILVLCMPGMIPGELRSPTLWLCMLPYSFAYVFGVQMLLLTALTLAHPISVSIGSNCLFFMSLGWAAGDHNTSTYFRSHTIPYTLHLTPLPYYPLYLHLTPLPYYSLYPTPYTPPIQYFFTHIRPFPKHLVFSLSE